MTSPSDPKDRRPTGAWQRPGRGAYVRESLHDSHAGQVSSPESRMSRGSFSECPGSVSGHDGGDIHGLCTWCGRRVNSPVPRPELGQAYRTELDLAYRYHHDPDYGGDPYDV